MDHVIRVEDELKRNLGGQKQENVKLQSQISNLKQEKTQLQQNLIGLQRRIAELELSIGGDKDEQWTQGVGAVAVTALQASHAT